MWTSSQARAAAMTEERSADLGVVTVGGEEAGVYLNGERRWVRVLSPGGYRWRPAAGETVLVLKTGTDEESCILAAEQAHDTQLEPGEVELSGPDCSVCLSQNGVIELSGSVTVNGEELSDMIRRIAVSAVMGG